MIIAMSGKMGSGKDTGVKYLIQKYNFTRMAFADDLKNMCMHAFDLAYDQCHGEAEKFKTFDKAIALNTFHLRKITAWVEQNGFNLNDEQYAKIAALADNGIVFETPRHILQYIGTEICRDIVNIDYHAMVLKRNIDRSGAINIAIADCRFPNEREAIKSWGGTTILVTDRETSMAADDRSKSHASENSLGDSKDYDFTIKNDRTLEALHADIDNIMQGFLKLNKAG